MTTKLKLAYFGSPLFSARVLQQILSDENLPIEVKFVSTQVDKPVGRKQILMPTPVKQTAISHNLPVFETMETVRNNMHGIDLCLVYAYGQKIPQDMLKMTTWGFWNIHPSLLPKYRGVSPIAYPLLLGESITGASLMEMDERFDHGPILDQEAYSIQNSDTREHLENYLSEISYRLFKKNIQQLLKGKIQKREQDHSIATYTRLLTKEDGYIPFPVLQKCLQNKPLKIDEVPPFVHQYISKYSIDINSFLLNAKGLLFNLYRGLFPWPGVWTLLPIQKRLKITKMALIENLPCITHVQLEGKKEVERKAFERAYQIDLS